MTSSPLPSNFIPENCIVDLSASFVPYLGGSSIQPDSAKHGINEQRLDWIHPTRSLCEIQIAINRAIGWDIVIILGPIHRILDRAMLSWIDRLRFSPCQMNCIVIQNPMQLRSRWIIGCCHGHFVCFRPVARNEFATTSTNAQAESF